MGVAVRGAQPNQWLLAQQRNAPDFWIDVRHARCESEIQPAFRYFFGELRAQGTSHSDVDTRIGCAKTRKCLWQQESSIEIGATQRDPARNFFCRQTGSSLVVGLQHCSRIRQQHLTMTREAQPAQVVLEYRMACGAFQPANLKADGRLCSIEATRNARHTLLLDQQDESPKKRDFERTAHAGIISNTLLGAKHNKFAFGAWSRLALSND